LTPYCESSIHDKRIADAIGYCVPSGTILYQDTGFQDWTFAKINTVQLLLKPFIP